MEGPMGEAMGWRLLEGMVIAMPLLLLLEAMAMEEGPIDTQREFSSLFHICSRS